MEGLFLLSLCSILGGGRNRASGNFDVKILGTERVYRKLLRGGNGDKGEKKKRKDIKADSLRVLVFEWRWREPKRPSCGGYSRRRRFFLICFQFIFLFFWFLQSDELGSQESTSLNELKDVVKIRKNNRPKSKDF